jgi:hypothetical protein
MKKVTVITLMGCLLVGVAILVSTAWARDDDDAPPPNIVMSDIHIPKADEGRPAKGEWSGFTVDQLAKHLGLKGGNISFKFERPVFINVTAVQKKGKDEPVNNTFLNHWSDKASIQHDLFVMVQDSSRVGDYVAKRITIRCTDADGTYAGCTMNSRFASETGNHGHGGAWRNGLMRVQENSKATVYEFYDPQEPEEKFFRVTVRFLPSKPSTDK